MSHSVTSIFSYGSLRDEAVQLANFGRVLRGADDELVDFVRTRIEVPGWHKAASSGVTHYANVEFVAGCGGRVAGRVFELTEVELTATDAYERDADYVRIMTTLASGRRAWVYVSANKATRGK